MLKTNDRPRIRKSRSARVWTVEVPVKDEFGGSTRRHYDTWENALKAAQHWWLRGHLQPPSYRVTSEGRSMKTCYCEVGRQ